MLRSRSTLFTLAIAAVASLAVPVGSASATDADVAAACEASIIANIGTNTITNRVYGGAAGDFVGCVTTVHASTGAISSVEVSVVSGWGYSVKRTTTSVRVDFTSTAGEKVTYRIEPGKLKIR
ncbi:MAG: hypothetical protein ABMA25_03270 [Ilumatobacteraceae bacterium]